MEKYRKIKVVGKGNFGYAMLVQSVIDRKFYIMKVIDVSRMETKQKEEALNEVHVLKSMRHPYIVTYRESFMSKRCLCIVMDYADGGDMYTKIAQQKKINKPFGEEQVMDWFVQIALALKHVHERKILHRDLKTQNIFLTSKGEVKMGDFGISRVLQDTYDCAQTAIGTPYYLSPEICQEKPYNQKSDIWSLGCILYEMLTLRHAFDASSMKGLVLKILRGNYPPVPNFYTQEIHNIVAEMLKKDPIKRPSIRNIVENDFLASRISALLSRTLARHEFTTQGRRSKILHIGQESGHRGEAEPNKPPRDQENLEELKNDIFGHPPPDKGEAGDKVIFRQHSHPQNLAERKGFMHPKQPPPEEEKLSPSSHQKSVHSSNPNFIKPGGDLSEANDHDEEYKVLIDSLKKCLGKRHKSKVQGNTSDSEDFEEKESERVYAKFLTPEGRELPGVCETDTVTYRIEALRCYLEQMLGEDIFIHAYQYITVQEGEEEDDEAIRQIVGISKERFVPLIYQLIVCEDAHISLYEQYFSRYILDPVSKLRTS